MSTSLHDGRIIQQIDLTEASSLNGAYVRDVIQNNLSHYADEFGQVLVNWTGYGLDFGGGSPYSTSLNQVISFGPFSLKLREDRSPYKLRVRVAGSRVSGSATDRIFKVSVCPASVVTQVVDSASLAAESSYVLYTEAMTSSTPSWLVGASYAGDANLISIPSSMLTGWIAQTPTRDFFDGVPASVEQCLVSVNVSVVGTNGTVVSLDGLYVAEYIGL